MKLTSLSTSLARYRWRQLAVLALLGCAMTTTALGTRQISDNAVAAIDTSVDAELGGHEYALQVGNPEIIPILAADSRFLMVSDDSGQILVGDLAAPTIVRTTAVPAEIGVLVDGRFAASAGEATVSIGVSDVVQLGIGDSAIVERSDGVRGPVQIVGLTVDPAEKDRASIVVLDANLDPAQASVWLSDIDPYSITDLQPYLDRRVASYQSAGSVETFARFNIPGSILAIQHLTAPVLVLGSVLILSALVLLIPSIRPDIDGLTAAGVSTRSAWTIVSHTAFVAVATGQLAGAAITAVAIRSTKGSIAGMFNQQWMTLTFPVSRFALMIVVTFTVALVGPTAAHRAGKLLKLASRLNLNSTTLTSLIAGASAVTGSAILAVAYAASRQDPPTSTARLAPLGALLVAMAIPFALPLLTERTIAPASQLIVSRFSSGIRTTTLAAAAIALSIGSYSAIFTHDANALETISTAPQPPGSLLVYEISDGAVDPLLEDYRQEGGSDVARYTIPNETAESLRVTTIGIIQCMQDAPGVDPNLLDQSCYPQDTASPINTVMLQTDLDPETKLVDPTLLDGDEVGLLLFSATPNEPPALAQTYATGEPRLGGNMPGLVVSPTSDIAEHFGLKVSEYNLVALLDFHELSEAEQAHVRGTIARVAPGAQVADSTLSSSFDSERSVATTSALIGAALVIAVVVLGGVAVSLGNQRTQRVLIDIGGSAAYRAKLAVRWLASPALTMIAVMGLTKLSASIAGVNAPGSTSWWWLLPPVSGLVACVVVFLYVIQPKDRLQD